MVPAVESVRSEPLRLVSVVVAVVALAVIAGAWAFELAGYAPCPLCLQQRWPYYLGIPLALALAVFQPRLPKPMTIAGFAVLVALFAWGLSIGVYQSGAEMRLWQGPTSCATADTAPVGDVGNLMAALQSTPVVSCIDPALQPLGLSLATWNAVTMAGLIALILYALARRRAA